MIIWHDVIQGTAEWFALREDKWTGSIAIRLLQGKPLPRSYDWGGNDATRRGTLLEHAMMREYERKYGRKMQRPGFVTNTVYPNAGYSPDGIDGAWLIEMKAFMGKKLQDLIDGKIPLEVQVQIFFGMIITGKRKARLLAIDPDAIDKEQLTVHEISYEKIIGNNIRKKLRLDMKARQANLTPSSVAAIL